MAQVRGLHGAGVWREGADVDGVKLPSLAEGQHRYSYRCLGSL